MPFCFYDQSLCRLPEIHSTLWFNADSVFQRLSNAFLERVPGLGEDLDFNYPSLTIDAQRRTIWRGKQRKRCATRNDRLSSTGKGLGADRQPRRAYIVILFRWASKTGEQICEAAGWTAAVMREGRGWEVASGMLRMLSVLGRAQGCSLMKATSGMILMHLLY